MQGNRQHCGSETNSSSLFFQYSVKEINHDVNVADLVQLPVLS